MLHETIQLYPDNKLVTLTTYVLDDSSEMLKGKARPGIIICPGGGYFSCSDREAEPIAMKYASAGYHTFVLRYTIYNDNGMALPDLSKPLPLKEDRIFPRQIALGPRQSSCFRLFSRRSQRSPVLYPLERTRHHRPVLSWRPKAPEAGCSHPGLPYHRLPPAVWRFEETDQPNGQVFHVGKQRGLHRCWTS